ncbi:MAG: serine/threonine protein kinase, partial [Chloroflexota bacterium]|nr:serine/threonine protein kinase [Chloroflexota bacterium]
MDSLIGTTLGQYQIIEEIGRGGMAVVYKARQPSLNRFVALKVPLPQLTHDQAFVARFKREARIAAGLQNPHVLRIYEVSDALPYYIAMEYVEGESLADLLRRGALEPARAASILQQIADALDYAHARGIAHRDVKPSNIMIDRSGNAFLTDFGIARAAEGTRLTQTGAALGTPEYMSPEQCEGKSTDARSDIYSLGIVTYEMVTGRVPFHADTPLVTLYQQVHYLPPAIRRLNSHISLAVERVVLKALAKAPGQRYASAGEFARDFAMPPRVAEPRTVPAKAVRPQQTAVAQVLAMIAAVIVPLGVGGVLWASSQTAALMAKNLPAATNMPPSPTFTPRVISPTFTPTTTATPIVPACPDAPAIPAFAASPSTLGLGDS